MVITGIAGLSPLGSSKEELWEGLSSGRSGVGPLSFALPEDFPVRCGGEAQQFSGSIGDFGPLSKDLQKTIRKGLKVMCRECQMGVAAAQRALTDARVEAGQFDPERVGVSFGADYMLTVPEEFIEGVRNCLTASGDFEFSRWAAEGLPKMSPLWLLKYLPNMPASHVAIYNDFRGPNNSLTLREAAGNAALLEAQQIIARGHADVMLVGATGTRLQLMKLIHAAKQDELAQFNADPARASRPFDRQRTGMVLAEAAGALILEELESAQARGATIYGEVVAGASSSVADPHLAARRDRAMKNVLAATLASAGYAPEEIGHVHAHGLSTRSADVEEAWAIDQVFGSRREPVPVVAAKSYMGNAAAGCGLVEVVASLLALREGRLFRTLNYETPDPQCPVAVVTDADTPAGENFINVNVTPQAQATAILVRRHPD